MNAEIITIGTELLLGEIVDTNQRDLATYLRSIGMDVFQATTVGDNAHRIAQAVREAMARAKVVVTSGGLGPTVDDPTREAIAEALQVPSEFHPGLWEQIQERFARMGRTPTDNNRRQAFLPRGAEAIENPVGSAPAFLVEAGGSVVIALPGVPSELHVIMERSVLPLLRERLQIRAVIKSRILRTAGAGESWIDDRIQDLEKLTNPTVGLAAHPARVDIRITAKAESDGEAEEMIRGVEDTLRERLGKAIYGVDQESLEEATLQLIRKSGWRLATVEVGSGLILAGRLTRWGDVYAGGCVFPPGRASELQDLVGQAQAEHGAEVGLGVVLTAEADRQALSILVRSPLGEDHAESWYAGPPRNVGAWSAALGLDLLRRKLIA
jgi:competence/damage-inducible protein CinA-like protein